MVNKNSSSLTDIDPITETRLKLVYPDLAKRWRRVNEDMITLHSRPMRVADGIRSMATQWIYWCKGRRLTSTGAWVIEDQSAVVTYAEPGESLHHYGLALDTVFLGKDPYLKNFRRSFRERMFGEFGRIAKFHGLDWAGDWKGKKKELGHCEKRYGLSLVEIRALYVIKGDTSVLWAKCDQYLKEVGGMS